MTIAAFSFSGRPTGRGAGVLTLNPQGLQRGPKRVDLELAQKEWRRDARLEGCAVNVDCFGALEVTREADAPGAKYAF